MKVYGDRWIARTLAVMALGFMACGEDSAKDDPSVSSNNMPSTNNTTPQLSCPDECAKKAAQCQAPAGQVDALCGMFCGAGDAASLVRCLQNNSCQTLSESFERGPTQACKSTPPKDMGSQTPDMGTPASDMMSSGSCEIGQRECPEDFVALRCERGPGGIPMKITERCNAQLPSACEAGWCTNIRLGAEGSSCVDKSECRAPNACEGGTCCQVPGEVCAERSDCCGGESCVSTKFGYKVCKGI